MKNSKTLIVAAFALSLSLPSARADEGTAAPGKKRERPCRVVKEACEAAGFKRGGHKEGGKGLWKDCIAKLKAGEKVEGVNVSAETVAACQKRRESIKMKRKSLGGEA